MDKKLKKIWISIFVVISLISIMDIIFMKSGLFANSLNDYTSGNFLINIWPLFYKLALGLMFIFAFLYYFFYNKDISEAVSIFVGSFILHRFGASDFLFFIFQGKWIPDSLPWLDGNFPINLFGPVTNITLILDIIIGGIIVYYLTKILKDKF